MTFRYDKDAFAGTADFYLRFRHPYPEALLRDLIARTRIGPAGRLLDLACGPGRLALALAGRFREVWAVDLEPEMIEVGRAEGVRRGVTHVRWSVGRAEDVDAPEAAFDLITIGEAFHRLDQERIAERSFRWLRPGGGLASLGVYTILSAKEPWQRVVTDLVGKWTGADLSAPKASAAETAAIGPENDEGVMRAAGFLEVASHPFVVRQGWTADSILGYLYSTSVCSRRVLGDRAEAFAAEVRSALLRHDPSGLYWEDMRFGYTFGRRPC
jgi:ubiquinone/menaquinone biosynthesis C-methylase UbiE